MLNLFEKAFVVVALVYLSGGFLPYILAGNTASGDSLEGDPVAVCVMAAVYGITVFCVARHWHKFMCGVLGARSLLALLALVAASAAWSPMPLVTLRRTLALLATTTLGIFIGTRFPLRDQVQLVIISLTAAGLLSCVFAIIVPNSAIHIGLHNGDWRGIFSHKNIFGRVMAMNCIAVIAWPARWRLGSVLKLALVAFSATLLGLSGSRTAFLLLLVLLALVPVYRMLRWQTSAIVPLVTMLALVAGAIATILLEYSDFLLGIMGRDATLTGRTLLWKLVADRIAIHPYFGYGFNAFWLGMQGDSASIVSSAGFMAKHAHNGYLDLLLDVGLLGVAFFLVTLVVNVRKALTWARTVRSADGLWPLMLLTFIVLYNLTESAILEQNNIVWALYVALSAAPFLATSAQSITQYFPTLPPAPALTGAQPETS